MRTAIALAATGVMLALGGCGSSDTTTAPDSTGSPTGPRSGAPTASDPTSPSGSSGSSGSTTGSWPVYAVTDYTYRLEVLCYCPQIGPMRVRVVDDKVVAATVLTGRDKGKDAPDFARLTINDIIGRANSLDVAQVDMTWPDGRDHPDVVQLDPIKMANDDEVTYTIEKVTPAR